MEYFDHTDVTEAQAKAHGRQRVVSIKVHDLSKLPDVVMHPTMKNITYFMVEYARALQMDMLKYPAKYKGVPFDYIYEKMATAIANNKAKVRESAPIAHACRCAGIPCRPLWIQTYIWYDQPVPTRLVVLNNGNRGVTSRAYLDSRGPNSGRVPKFKRISPRLPPERFRIPT